MLSFIYWTVWFILSIEFDAFTNSITSAMRRRERTVVEVAAAFGVDLKKKCTDLHGRE
jgi:hypothetical protein